MKTNSNSKPGTDGVQVFELTMDNPENQDELNRRLRKPGELGHQPHPPAGSAGKKKEKKKKTS
jgi:hypothetical protein